MEWSRHDSRRCPPRVFRRLMQPCLKPSHSLSTTISRQVFWVFNYLCQEHSNSLPISVILIPGGWFRVAFSSGWPVEIEDINCCRKSSRPVSIIHRNDLFVRLDPFFIQKRIWTRPFRTVRLGYRVLSPSRGSIEQPWQSRCPRRFLGEVGLLHWEEIFSTANQWWRLPARSDLRKCRTPLPLRRIAEKMPWPRNSYFCVRQQWTLLTFSASSRVYTSLGAVQSPVPSADADAPMVPQLLDWTSPTLYSSWLLHF